ncbi:MAG: succinate dehydrogenase [Chlamydiae bacterium CG10_big_fil_rev_8_21_14_0_10_42_34]|nr:MAG: succinate dehydrogenase [Chlamydiae bacterium CG10_big_fil_rev_8_21_14_0_10_42_34]
MTTRTEAISSTFLWRRVHSLMGLWLVLYLIVHLIVNSQAALWLGDDGSGFVQMVNSLESLPYLQVIEITLIGIPLAIHGYWGVLRAFKAKTNSGSTDGSSPSMKYGRSKAFTWQRLTSWVLLFGIIAHVIQMRFVDMPDKIRVDNQEMHVVHIKDDPGIESLAKRIGVTIKKDGSNITASAATPGKVILLTVRETFKSPLMCVLYTIFVLAAAFHAFNGFWTSLITWGALLSYRSQKAFLPICWVGVGMLAFLGLAAIWGSYWINLRA